MVPSARDFETPTVWEQWMRLFWSSHFSIVTSGLFLLTVRAKTILTTPCDSYSQNQTSEKSLDWLSETATSKTTAGHILERPCGGLLGAHPPSPCLLLLVPLIVLSVKPWSTSLSPVGSTAANRISWKATRAAACSPVITWTRSNCSAALYVVQDLLSSVSLSSGLGSRKSWRKIYSLTLSKRIHSLVLSVLVCSRWLDVVRKMSRNCCLSLYEHLFIGGERSPRSPVPW